MSFVSPEMQSVDDPLRAGLLHLPEGHITLQAVPHSQHVDLEYVSTALKP